MLCLRCLRSGNMHRSFWVVLDSVARLGFFPRSEEFHAGWGISVRVWGNLLLSLFILKVTFLNGFLVHSAWQR